MGSGVVDDSSGIGDRELCFILGGARLRCLNSLIRNVSSGGVVG